MGGKWYFCIQMSANRGRVLMEKYITKSWCDYGNIENDKAIETTQECLVQEKDFFLQDYILLRVKHFIVCLIRSDLSNENRDFYEFVSLNNYNSTDS